jgi:transcription elongation factor GreA
VNLQLQGEELMERVPITREGYDRLRSELQRLQKEERPAVIKAIAEARGHGDISENAEYEAAKDKQGMIEGRIIDLSQKLGRCEIIEGTSGNGSEDRVIFGSTVVVEDLETEEQIAYRMVGPFEADIQSGTLSVVSPLGKALIGKQEGDEIRVQTPKGLKEFEIVEVRF